MRVQQILLVSVVTAVVGAANATLLIVKLLAFDTELTVGSPIADPAGAQFVS